METGRGLAMPPFPKRGVDDGQKRNYGTAETVNWPPNFFASHTSF